jgi:dUTP pyrophosphatase
MKILVKRINQAARLPVYNHPGDAGLDLFSCQAMTIGPGETAAVPTGLQLAIPFGYAGLVWDKSGLALQGIHRLAGVIDAGYRGEVKIVLTNLSQKPFVITSGMKIAQLLVQPVEIPEPVEVETLDETRRGEAGFGSTGLF